VEPLFSRGTKFSKASKRTAALHHHQRNNERKRHLSRGVTQHCRVTNNTTNTRFNSDSFVRKRLSCSVKSQPARPPNCALSSGNHYHMSVRCSGGGWEAQAHGAARRCRLPLAAAAGVALVREAAGAGWQTAAPRWVAVTVWRWGRYAVLREENNSCIRCCWISQLQEWWLALTFDLRIHLSFRLERGPV
jgi:hypothetical protein